MNRNSYLLLLGGSFNPPHCGHMRIAIECAEAFAPAPLLFLPCAVPPHKSSSGLLPFALRCAMLRACIASLADAGLRERFSVSEVENERQGPSYTVDTLRLLSGTELRAGSGAGAEVKTGTGTRAEAETETKTGTGARAEAGRRLLFILGSEDYERLDSWREWARLPEYADLFVVPRSPAALESFAARSPELWPGAASMDAEARRRAGLPERVAAAFALPGGGRLLYMPQPLLNVSSSLVRERRAQGRSLDFLLPEAARRLLDAHEEGNGP